MVKISSEFKNCLENKAILGSWQKATCLEDIKERAIFEASAGGYINADDTGYFSVGNPKEEGKKIII